MKMIKYSLLPILLVLSFDAAAGVERTVEMKVDGLVCAFCAQGINKNLRKQSAVDDVFVSLKHKVVAVTLRDGQTLDDATLDEVLTDAGYSLREVKRSNRSLDEIRADISQ